MSENKHKSGMVSIVGRPNVGKSTLLNTIVGEKIAIVSRVPQTTRNQVRGIYNDDRGQIVFIDTPGIHYGRDKLDDYMNQTSSGTLTDVDCLIYLVDPTRRVGQEEESIAARIKEINKPVILGLNKIDSKAADVPSYIEFWERVKGQKVQDMENFQMIALSGSKGSNIDSLIDLIFDFLPEGPPVYPEDIICDVPQRMAISDIIREKLINNLKEELPHSVGVVIEEMKPVKGKTNVIKALILVEKESQKGIVVGKNGSLLKKIGSQAREDLQELLETQVFIELFVKTKSGWRDDLNMLQDLGYHNM